MTIYYVMASVLPVFLAGCGSHNSNLPASVGSFPAVAGAWLFSGANAAPILAAGLLESNGVLTGTGTVYGCSTTAEQVVLSGSVSTGGQLQLSSGPLAGGASLSVHGQLSADGKSLSGAALAVVGSGCNLTQAQSVTAQVYAPAQGNYSGTFVGSDGASTPVTAVLTQSSNPGPGGSYTLGGSVSFPNSPCLGTATIQSAQSTVTGGALSATYAATVNGQTVTISATGTADANAVHVNITNWTISGGLCDGYSGTGSLVD